MGEGGWGMGGLECIGVRGDWLGTGVGWSDGGGLHPLACMAIPLMLTDDLISAILRVVVCRGRPAPSNPSPSLPPTPPAGFVGGEGREAHLDKIHTLSSLPRRYPLIPDLPHPPHPFSAT